MAESLAKQLAKLGEAFDKIAIDRKALMEKLDKLGKPASIPPDAFQTMEQIQKKALAAIEEQRKLEEKIRRWKGK